MFDYKSLQINKNFGSIFESLGPIKAYFKINFLIINKIYFGGTSVMHIIS